MDTPQVIRHNKKILAMVFRSGIDVPTGVHFYTPPDSPFQAGIHNRDKGVCLPPHIHRVDRPLTISFIQELLWVMSGHIRVTLYTQKGTPHKKVELKDGDSILLMNGGHGVEFFSKTKLFEIKQGPYAGSVNAKIFLKP